MAMKRNAQPSANVEEKIAAAKQKEKAAAAEQAEEKAVAAEQADVVKEKSMEVKTNAASNGAMVKILDDVENAFVSEFGVLPRLKASNGNIIDGDDNLLGDEVQLQIVSWNRNYVAGPCANSAPAELVKYSLDRHEFADGSGTLDAHIEDLKEAGYTDACVKEYYEVVAELLGATKPTELIGELVQVQLSPTSVREFEKYRLQTSFKIARGRLSEAQGSLVTATAEVVSAKGNTWTKMTFKPAEVG